MSKDVGSKAKQGIMWTGLANIIQYVFRLGSSIVLARILFPEDFGLMGMILIVVNFARRLSNFGFGSALIQRKELKKEHSDTVFWVNFFTSVIITGVLIFSSSYIAEFFEHEKIRLLLIVIAFNFILSSLAGVPYALLNRKLKFKERNIAQTIGRLFNFSFSVIFAVAGFGVWSLVYGVLIGTLVELFAIFYYTRWLPSFQFHLWALKDVFSFGFWVYINNYIKYAIENIDYFIIAKVLNATQLGYYERAFNLMSIPRKEILRRFNSIFFSAYSRIYEDDKRLVQALIRVISTISIITYPLMIWLFFAAPSLIPVLYGSKWYSTIYPLQVMCISGVIHTFTTMFYPVLNAKGLVRESAGRNVIYLVVLGISVWFGVHWGINGVAWGVVLASFVWFFQYLSLTIKNTSFSIIKFINAQKAGIIYGVFQITVLFAFQIVAKFYIPPHSWIMLLSVTFLSMISILTAHFVFRFKNVEEIFVELFQEIRQFLHNFPILKRLNLFAPKV